jgi:hypothetical protein
MEKRRQPRHRRGFPCEIRTACTQGIGLVQDVSSRGLFVKTHTRLESGGLVDVLFNDCGVAGGLRIEAGVARVQAGSRRFESKSETGFGLEVIPPWQAFERWVLRPSLPPLESSVSVEEAAKLYRAIVSSKGTFRVQLMLRDRTRRRQLTLKCDSAFEARALALRQEGGAWMVRSVTRIESPND